MESQNALGNIVVKPALANYLTFRTNDLDEARGKVSRIFYHHGLQTVGRNQRIDAEMYFRQIRCIGLGCMRYGANVLIDPGKPENFALIQMPIGGLEAVDYGTDTFCSNARVASVLSPTLPLKMQPDSGAEKLFVKIERDILKRHCRQHMDG